MRPYEAMVVLRPDLDQDALQAVQTRLLNVITDQGGQITHVDPWGKRRLAYEIQGFREGYYVVIKFQAKPGVTAELERVMRITDAVIRFLVVRDEFPTAPPQSGAETEPAKADAAAGAGAESAEAGASESGAAGEAGAAVAAEAAAEPAGAEAAGTEQAEPAAERQN